MGAENLLLWMPIAVLFSAAISVAVLWGINRLGRGVPVDGSDQTATRSMFLLKDNKLVDQSAGPSDVSNWADLRAWLGDRFCGLPEELPKTTDGPAQVFRPVSAEDDAVLTIRTTLQGQSIILEDKVAPCPSDRHALLRENKQAGTLHSILEQAPAVIFGMDATGILKWGNARFERLSVEDRCVFLKVAKERGPQTNLQASLDDPVSSRTRHYELSVLTSDDNVVIYANDVTRLVEADSVRNAFVQTLTKTFADLSTGLTVFDRDQRLVLFNPAILDLTDLSAEFLSARPHMMEFFDRLRDNHMLPEPKSYASWRGQINEMINAATGGHYSENWSLPGGMTYKLTGRPHPNGAVAFLIEDITDEMALTRQSRSQLETHQSILDAIEEPIAVIGPDGALMICNAAFVDVVGFDPDASFAPTSLKAIMQACQERFPNAALWTKFENGAPIKPFDTHVQDRSGAMVRVRIEPLREGLSILNLSKPAQVQLSA